MFDLYKKFNYFSGISVGSILIGNVFVVVFKNMDFLAMLTIGFILVAVLICAFIGLRVYCKNRNSGICRVVKYLDVRYI